MENSPRQQEEENTLNSHSPNSSSSSSSNSNINGGVQVPVSPRPITRSEPNNPYPTTFVQADTTSFKQVVQMLTGSSDTAKQASSLKPVSDQPVKNQIPPRRQQGFKLYERRNSAKHLKISPLIDSNPNTISNFSPRKQEQLLSPSILDFPSLVLSPVTPLMNDPFNRLRLEEEKAIAEKGFFLHKSPATTPRDSEPRLLPLFPVTSPRVSGSSA